MFAIVRIGGRQYPVEVGKTIVVEKLPNEIGEEISLDEVLYLSDNKPAVGTPVVKGATITAEVVDQFKGKKIVVFKYKPKIRYRRKQGHRQSYTRLLVKDISAGSKKTRQTEAEQIEDTEA